MKIIVIEDEPITADRLIKLIGEVTDDFEIIEVIDTVEDSINYFKSHVFPDLIFMDIHLADGNSFEIFEKVDVQCPVIFTTAYDQYAIKAFKVNSIDYLLKPVKREELSAAINKFNRSMTTDEKGIPGYTELARLLGSKGKDYLKRLMIKAGQSIKAFDVSEVAYFSVSNKMVYAHLKTGQQHLVDFTMDFLEKSLDPEDFFRVNRSMIVSFNSIDEMVSYSKSRIKISLQPPFEGEVISSTERTASFKNWLSGH